MTARRFEPEDRVRVGPLAHSTGTVAVRSVWPNDPLRAAEYDVRMDSGNIVPGARSSWLTPLGDE